MKPEATNNVCVMRLRYLFVPEPDGKLALQMLEWQEMQVRMERIEE